MCNVPFHLFFFCNALSFQILQLVFCQTSGQPFARRVFIKDKWFTYTCGPLVRHMYKLGVGVRKNKTEIWHAQKKKEKENVYRYGIVCQCSCLKWPHEITKCHDVKRLPLQYGSQVSMSTGRTHTKKTISIKSESCTLFYKRLFFFLFFFKESH